MNETPKDDFDLIKVVLKDVSEKLLRLCKNSQRRNSWVIAESELFNEWLILGAARAAVKIPFIESLILAQDERWRRA